MYDAVTGVQKVYIDGVERISAASAVTWTMDRIGAGYTAGSWWPHTENFDCVVVADAYVGPEEAALVAVSDSLMLKETILRKKSSIK